MDKLEQKIISIIESRREEIIALGRDIFTHAEMGYKEYRTAGVVQQKLEELGIHPETGLAVTGVKGYLQGKEADGPVVAVIGELDALPIPAHPDANPETGASHCCGHNAQIAGMLGAAMALTDPEVRAALDGSVAFMAVPSEEFVDTAFKNGLMEQGIIRYGGGKSELIRIGAFDDIAVAVGHHIVPNIAGFELANNTTNGFVNKVVTFRGKSAHAAGSPHEGIDALNAATLAMHAIDLQRETFKDQDSVRIHSYLPRAGTAINVIAEEVCLESSVRAKNIPALQDADAKYDRSIRAGALALGCSAEIVTIPGYLPTVPLEHPELMSGVLTDLIEEEKAQGRDYTMGWRNRDFHEAGSTDYGELSSILPLYQFRTGGYTGQLHNSNVRVTDEQLAYVEPAKIFALMAYRLLKDGAAGVKETVGQFEPLMSKEEYFRFMEEMSRKEVFPTE